MQKLFDKILSEKIKTGFNNHQEPYNPADWENLKAQLTGKKRGLVIWLNIAKAASVVLFVGISTLYVNRNDENLQSLYKVSNNQINVKSNKNQEKEEVYIAQEMDGVSKIYKTRKKVVADSLQNDIENNIAHEINETESIKSIFVIIQTDSIKPEEFVALADSNSHDSSKQIVQVQLAEKDFEIDQKKRNSKFDFAVAIVSMYSYSTQGAEGNINMGGGFTTSYNISEKFSISSGLMIAQQSLSYSGRYEGTDMVYSNTLMDSKTTMVNNPASAESRIEFVGIDIPLNIKYKLKRLIVTTGISSLVFVSEKRTYSANATVFNTSFNSATNNYETVKTTENFQIEDKSPSFNRFDFASLFNVAVGYEFLLKKGSMMFEPFIKYPIGEISSESLKIGSAGLSLHYYF
ncbi:MAG: hypothetical protein DRJ10_00415 [Bacteroidetes bacterium]|nr:MAG: hypothetical protein DRJ10_00415 [Bacteroidota bacterium]